MLASLLLKNETNLDKIFAIESYLFIKDTKEFISGTVAASLKMAMKTQTKKYKKSKGGVQTFEALLDAYRARLNEISVDNTEAIDQIDFSTVEATDDICLTI